MAKVSENEIRATVETIRAIADCIRDAGSIPSGNLYALVMGHLSLSQFQSIIGILERSGLVRQSGHVLHWAG